MFNDKSTDLLEFPDNIEEEVETLGYCVGDCILGCPGRCTGFCWYCVSPCTQCYISVGG
jgi:hypothetical protein